MRHPFDLNSTELETVELEFSEEITSEEAALVGGGLSIATTRALGEEGGYDYPIKPIEPIYTSLAFGEEGGWCPTPLPQPLPHPIPEPLPIKPPFEVTTMAIGEEGGEELW
jgi:hypothetical protein